MAVVQVFRRVDLEADVDPLRVERVEDRSPAAGELVEPVLDQPVGPLRIGIEIGPEQRAGEGHVPVEPEAA